VGRVGGGGFDIAWLEYKRAAASATLQRRTIVAGVNIVGGLHSILTGSGRAWDSERRQEMRLVLVIF